MPETPEQAPALPQAQDIMQSLSNQPPTPLSFSGDLAANLETLPPGRDQLYYNYWSRETDRRT